MLAFLTANIPEPEFIELDNWPSNTLGLNLIDYSICGALKDHLKEVRTSCWEQEQIGQNLIDKVIDQWLIRISLVMRAKGGHI